MRNPYPAQTRGPVALSHLVEIKARETRTMFLHAMLASAAILVVAAGILGLISGKI